MCSKIFLKISGLKICLFFLFHYLTKKNITIYIYKNASLFILRLNTHFLSFGWIKKDKFNTCTCFDHSLSPHSTTQALICTKHNILSQKGIHPIISTKSTQNNEAGSSPAHVHNQNNTQFSKMLTKVIFKFLFKGSLTYNTHILNQPIKTSKRIFLSFLKATQLTI